MIFLFSSLVVFFARFATSVVVARSLGAQGKGIYTLAITAGALLSLCLDLGLSGAFTYLSASKRHSAGELFTFALLMSIAFSLIGGGLFYWLYSNLLAGAIFSGVKPLHIMIILAYLPFSLLTSFISSILLGLQHIVSYNLINVTRMIANLIFQVVSALYRFGVTGAILSWALANGVAFGLTLWLFRQELHFGLTETKRMLRSSFSFGIKNYIANLLTFFNYRLDTFIVNYFSGPTSVGLYSTGVAAAELVWMVPNSISATLFPKSASLDRKTAGQLTARTCRQTLLLLVPLTLAFGVVGIWLIPFIYGQNFSQSVSPFLWLLPGIIAITISKIIFANLSGSGKPQYATITSTITICLTVILDIALIPSLNINGAAIASSLAYTTSAILAIFWFVKETQITWQATLIPGWQDVIYLYQRGSYLLMIAIHKIKAHLIPVR